MCNNNYFKPIRYFMKRIVCLNLLSWLCISAGAQTSLCLSTDKTTSLIFPFPIKHVDRGTPAVLAQQIKDVPTILLVKAGAKNFPETNLSVATEDGSLYTFSVCYAGQPPVWVYHLPIQIKASLANYANAILDNPATVKGIKDENWNIQSEIKGIYVKDDVMYFQLSIRNSSSIDYDVELMRFYTRDKNKSKRTAIQEADLKPLHISGNYTAVKAGSTAVAVVAFNKFTIPDAKYLGMQIMEKNGGRHLHMKLGNRQLVDAIMLPDLK